MKHGRSVELVRIENDLFTFIVNGPYANQASYPNRRQPTAQLTQYPWPLKFTVPLEGDGADFPILEIRGGIASRCTVVGSENQSELYAPLFYETIAYDYQLVEKNSGGADFICEASVKATKLRVGNVQSGTFSFGDFAGLTRLSVFTSKPQSRTDLTVLVGSLKVDYFSERLAMLSWLDSRYRALLYRAISPTYETAKQIARPISDTEFASLWRKTMGKLLRKVVLLESKSLQQRQPLIAKVRPERLRRLDPTSRRFIRRHGANLPPTRAIPVERRVRSHDSTENRHVKAQLSRLCRALRLWAHRHQEASHLSVSGRLVLSAILDGSAQVDKALGRPFWRGISDDPMASSGRALFEATYVSLERDFQHLRRGLSLAARGRIEIDLASMPKLYESWAFVRLAGLVTTVQGEPGEAVFRIECGALQAKLTEGRNARVSIGNATLTPQRLVRTIASDEFFSPYVPQQPDIFMELTTDYSIIIFDAKYRATVSYSGEPREFTNIELLTTEFNPNLMDVTARSEDYNVLHRYRDAILRSDRFGDRACHAAYVLFPVRPMVEADASKILGMARKFYLGALPFLPGAEDTSGGSPNLLAGEPYEETRCVSSILKDALV